MGQCDQQCPASLTVVVPPIILSQPQSLTVIEGAPASFSVLVSGTPLFYYFHWQKNGTNLFDRGNISGSTTANLLLSSTTANDMGNYRVIITNACGNVVTSSVATLTVIAKIQWTQWTNATPGVPGLAWGTNAVGVCVSYSGEVHSLYVNSPSWKLSTTFSGGTIPNPPPTNYNSIQLYGGNPGINTITFSKPVTDPVIAIWNLGGSGLTASFEFQTTNQIAIESGGPSDRYSSGTSIIQIGNTIDGTNGNGTIQFHGTFTQISWIYPWIFPTYDDYYGFPAFTVGVPSFPPDIWLETPVITPTNTVFQGSPPVTISETAFGSLPLAYQWQTDGGGGSSLTNIPGAITNFYAFLPQATGTYNFDVVVSDSSVSVTSVVAVVTVYAASAPIITQDTGTADFGPITNIFAFIGGNVNFFANFVGTMPITNQWLFSNGGAYAPIAGATNELWILTNVQSPSSVGFYRLGATNAYGSSNSTPAHLTALADPGAPPSNGVTNMYSHCVMTNNPWAYWKFEETNDTLHSSMQAYDYSGHNFDATYGNGDGTIGSGCLDGGETIHTAGQFGPGNYDSYSGFPANNGCATMSTMSSGADNGYLTVPPLNLNTNTVTFTMWIYINPNDNLILPSTGLFMNRNGSRWRRDWFWVQRFNKCQW